MKRKKSFTVKNTVSSVRTKFRAFRKQIFNIKKQKEQVLAQTHIPAREKKEQMVVELNAGSIAKSAAVVLIMVILFYFLFEIRGILLTVFISFLLAAALDPLVDKMQKRGLPRSLSVLLIYIVLFVLAGLFVTNVVTLIADQVVEIGKNVGQFVSNLSEGSKLPFADQLQPYLDQLYKAVDLQAATAQLQGALQVIASQLLSISIGLLNLLLVLILTFFMTVGEKAMEEFYRSLFPSRYSQYITTRLEAVKDQIGYWLRGQILVSIIAAVLSYIGLAILGVNYALTLAVIAGISMVVPVIGRVFAWLIAFPIVFNQDPWLALWMSMVYLGIQQIENNYIVPVIMSRAVGLSPIIIIIAMMIGGYYLGVLGLVLSIPIATTVAIFVRDYQAKAK